MTKPYGIDPGQPEEQTPPQRLPTAPEDAREKGLDGHDVELIGSMVTSDPPSSNMGESEEDQQ
ncbi:hypothetical protein [Deinococcus sp.]|uniref:hypothetical protein n=1 Tax=Deinococcus sp. TaxID=47478 RepID=UPI0025E2F1DC|nr:hypothetical protein [Deinococcus sp.]